MAAEMSEQYRKRGARRTALLLTLLAITFYLGFIAMSVLRAQ
jgi:hypothetical protein